MSNDTSLDLNNQTLTMWLLKMKEELENLTVEIENEDLSRYHSIHNLHSYLCLRKWNEKQIDQLLLQEGFTSFHHMKAHIHYSILKMLCHLNHNEEKAYLNPKLATQIKEKRTKEIFGKKNNSVMVTIDSKILKEQIVIKKLLLHGMNIARINCAHDTPNEWRAIVKAIRAAEKEIGCEGPKCKIQMELAGPKIRVQKIHSPFSHKNGRAFIKVSNGDQITIMKQKNSIKSQEDLPNIISINEANALLNARLKDKVYIDDGKIIGEINAISDDWLQIKILQTKGQGVKMSEENGLNFPDSLVHFILPSVTDEDIKQLPLVHELADIIGLSFVHHPRDLEKFRMRIQSMPTKKISVIAKIEPKEAVRYLAKIIHEGLHFDSFGIMIARGDLAVELGFTELAFVQEEILNICEASHTPVIWATGVLEKQAKTGLPVRSELTDAYMGLRADCLMLNKGVFIIEALKNLYKIIEMKEEGAFQTRFGSSSFIQYGF